MRLLAGDPGLLICMGQAAGLEARLYGSQDGRRYGGSVELRPVFH